MLARITSIVFLVLISTWARAQPLTQPAKPSSAELDAFQQVINEIVDLQALVVPSPVPTVVKLEPQQVQKLKDAFATTDQALTAFREKHKDQSRAIETARKEMAEITASAGVMADPQMLLGFLYPYRDHFHTLLSILRQHRRSVSQCLTHDQQVQWEAYTMRQFLDAHGLTRIQLSPQQQQRVEDACKACAEHFFKLGEDRRSYNRSVMQTRLMTICSKLVLTKEQRRQLGFPWRTIEDLQEDNPARDEPK